MGVFINKMFVGVTKDNLEDLWKLITIQLVCSLIPFLYLTLIPTNATISEMQKRESLSAAKKDEPEIKEIED